MMQMKNGLMAVGLMAGMGVAGSASAALVWTEAMPSSDNTGAQDYDWLELHNSGASAVDLTGYSWDDDADAVGGAVFGALSIGAGETILLIEDADEVTWRTLFNVAAGINVINEGELASGTFSGLSGNGETINLFDTTATSVATATFGASTAATSFEWDTEGNSLGLSVVGENGAYAATGDNGGIADIGSPGVVIPEPASLALLGLGAMMIAARRRQI